MSFQRGYCELGMLVNNDIQNILNENNEPITCTGYIKLTEDQVIAYKH